MCLLFGILPTGVISGACAVRVLVDGVPEVLIDRNRYVPPNSIPVLCLLVTSSGNNHVSRSSKFIFRSHV